MAELTRPFPPGSYPVIVIGSGPGGLQVSYSLRAQGVRHAVLSADPAPGGMFRRWPFFQRLLSWTKPYAPVARGTRAYERYDWNSLLGEEDGTPGDRADAHGRHVVLPVAPGDGGEPGRVRGPDRARGPLRLRLDRDAAARWPRRARTASRSRPSTAATRCGTLVMAVGVAQPYIPPGIGMEHAYHYADVRPAETYAGRRIVIIGKQNSGFELANGLLPWARQLVLVSPSHAKLSVDTNSLVGVRARYVQPYEDNVLGGGVSILDAAIDRVERHDDGALAVSLRRTDGGGDILVEADDLISATGFVAPLLDLPALGVATFGASALPVVSPWWESTTVPGIFVAGTLGQAAKGLQRHGLPANSGAVHGARYNARVLAGHIARTRFGIEPSRPAIDRAHAVGWLATELAEGPELFHQRGYLARLLTADPDGSLRDDGVQPLAHILDTGGPDAVAITLEADGSGSIYPVVFTRRAGIVSERMIAPDPLGRHDTPDARAALTEAVDRITRA